MTTKEEVLRLAEAAGLNTDEDCAYLRYNYAAYVNVTQQITKLIELAKAKGASEERTLSYEREREIVRLACLSAADQAREHQKEIEAIRNIERKE